MIQSDPVSPIDTLILIALPASGKSEVRELMAKRPDIFKPLGIGRQVHLDDYPYVEFMRMVDLVRERLGQRPIFFLGQDDNFTDRREWLVLIHLLVEDWQQAADPRPELTNREAVVDLFFRIDRAGELLKITPRLTLLPEEESVALVDGILEEVANPKGMSAAKKLVTNLYYWRVESLEGCTRIMEFSRGLPKDRESDMVPNMGYCEAFAAMPSKIIDVAVVLYIEVDLEDSMRKDAARVVVPEGHEGPVDSSIVHGLPRKVREGAYWGDDFESLLSDDGWVDFATKVGRPIMMPAAIFDNRGVGCTDVFRRPSDTWTNEEIAPAVEKLKVCLERFCAEG